MEFGAAIVIVIVAIAAWIIFSDDTPVERDTSHGSARFAEDLDIAVAGLFGQNGFTLGYRGKDDSNAFGLHPGLTDLRYGGDRHRLVAAPARSGKFVSCVGPLLLDEVDASALVLDVKGEAAMITRAHRKTGGEVHILNPFNEHRMGTDGYNPMKLLSAKSRKIVADATLLTEAFIDPKRGSDPHFEDQGRNLIKTLILYVATASEEEGQRTLGRVRHLLVSDLKDLLARMSRSNLAFGAVRDGANVFDGLVDRERGGVLSTARRMTEFLVDPLINDVLRRNSFSFAELKQKVGTVYLVIPPSRIPTHATFLRLIITSALIEFERVPKLTKEPVRVVLDEFPLIGRMGIVEKSYSVQAGYGVQFHLIVQNFSQLKETYGDFWETFQSSAGITQVFNTNDSFTAEYISRMLGETTVMVETHTVGSSSGTPGQHSSSSESVSTAPSRRRLLTPDEVRTLGESLRSSVESAPDVQLILPSGGYPIIAQRWLHYAHSPFQSRALAGPRL